MNGRLTIVEMIYHQIPDRQPFAVDWRSSRQLSSNERPYERNMIVTEEWEPLPGAWLTGCSMVHVSNQEGKWLQCVPTVEETAAIATKVIEVSTGGALWLVHPGESFRGCPADLSTVRIRSRCGSIKCIVTLFPG